MIVLTPASQAEGVSSEPTSGPYEHDPMADSSVVVGNLNVPSSKYAECMGYNSNGISTTAPAVEGAGIIIISEPEASALVGKARVDVLGFSVSNGSTVSGGDGSKGASVSTSTMYVAAETGLSITTDYEKICEIDQCSSRLATNDEAIAVRAPQHPSAPPSLRRWLAEGRAGLSMGAGHRGADGKRGFRVAGGRRQLRAHLRAL